MKKLTSLKQLKVGTKLKIIGKRQNDNYGSVSVKEIIEINRDSKKEHEILINRKKNYYFNFEWYLSRKSLWIEEAYVLPGTDKRLKTK
jgi:hypothetical protein